jgi:hypothetical protein
MSKRRHKTIIEALLDPSMFGAVPCFRDLSTWARWIVFLKAVYGLPLTPDEEAVFCQHTGRSRYTPPPGGYGESVAIVGRQAGKDRIGSVIQDYEALTAEPEPDGTETFAISVAQDQRSSLRTAFRYACTPFEIVPALAKHVKSRKADTWALSNSVLLAAYPCRPEAVRGIRARVVICSELAFYRNSENLPNDLEMLRAIRPCLATTGGRLVILSSPYWQSGALYDLHRQHYGREDSDTLIWQATAPEMNPTLRADYLTRMERDDPEAYRSEVLGQFRTGVSTFLDPEALAVCIDTGVRERPRQTCVQYSAFADVASGSGKDRFAFAIAHAEGDRAVLDVLRAWAPPFNPSGVIAESAELAKAYGCHEVSGDRYAPGFVLEGYRANGLIYRLSEQDRSTLYLELLPLVNAQRALLLDLPELLREFRGLERRRGTSGRDRVDHPSGGHDDLSNAAAGALVAVAASHIAHRCAWCGGDCVMVCMAESRPRTSAELEQEQARRDAIASEEIQQVCRQNGGYYFPGD